MKKGREEAAETAGTIRCFWAIELPEDVRAALERFCAEGRARGIRAGWASPATYHLTLCFMGHAAPDRVEEMVRQAQADFTACSPGALELAAAGVGAFPGPARPAVCWAGIEVIAGDLAGIRERVFQAARNAGCGPDAKAFHPHVTLARSRSGLESRMLAEWLRGAGDIRFGGPFRPARLVLFQSELRPDGARHTSRAFIPLG
ncbi:MAG TPA: RNA 2',3'-cyclic phosphodiesterase [Candidatus Hydrogenedentes bacterium]|nr:RNA 2',3'-cyclic phosphodiesterase [Candidatus Hydrogenedentota bacterium]